jgi:hypothetical protein
MTRPEKDQDRRVDDAEEDTKRSAIRKVVWHPVPILLLSNFANYLDWTNVSFAALTMYRDTGFDATTFGVGAGIFSLGYRVPSSRSSGGSRGHDNCHSPAGFTGKNSLLAFVVVWVLLHRN